jgi:glycosyltransferase involved in cell wall biosynthesis
VSLRVLHVAQPTDAGVPRVAGSLVADQVARGWDVSVASPQGWDLQRTAVEVGARWSDWTASRNPGFSTFAETRRLSRVLRSVEVDLVHLHSAKAGLAGRLALRGSLPTVFQPHAWSFEAAGGLVGLGAVAWERLAARWADTIVCVSGDEQGRGESVGVRGHYEVVPNGIDLGRWAVASDAARAAARSDRDLDSQAPIAVAVGRLARQKGQDVLLSAWPAVLERVPDALLVLVGDGPDLADLRAAGADRVRFAGDTDDVAPWLVAANVSVIPSRWEAGLSLVAMESMALGRSVVAADVAGMAEGLAGGCGAVVPVEDADALAQALIERLSDPERAGREGAAGRARVEERYDVRVASQRMAEVYERVLSRRSGRRSARGSASPG